MRQTPVNDYLEEISTELPEELYGHLSDAIYETVCEFDEEVAQLKAENDRLRELAIRMARALGVRSEWCNADCVREFRCDVDGPCQAAQMLSELGIEVSE